ncbi:hypothetical protein ACHQM5_002975 [Ranunculus cassubicifolius]
MQNHLNLEDVYGKLRHVLAEIEGHGQDLHLFQQDLERFGQTLSILVDRNNRLIEEQRLLRKRDQDLKDLVHSLYQSLQSILQSLQSSHKKSTVDDVKAREIVEDTVISCATSGTTDDESDDDGDHNNDHAAKILIDLSAQEQTAPESPKSRQLSVEKTMETQMEPVETQLADVGLGCRFQPTDQELIQFLKDKIAGKTIPMHIRERNLYGSEEPATIFNGNPASELYFVTQIKKKFDSGKKNSRVVGNGTWKIQNNKNVFEVNKKKIIGEKRALNFIDENTKKDKISWIMHEYNLCSAAENPERWTICRIKRGKGNRIGLDSSPRPIQNSNDDDLRDANDEDPILSKQRPVLETANDEELRQPKKRRVTEMLDLSLSLGRPSEKTVAPKNYQKDNQQNLFEHSMSSPPWGTFL